MMPRTHRTNALLELVFQFVGLLLLCLYFFRKNEGALYFGYDGAYMRQLLKFHFEWSLFTPDLVLNPLQGLSDFSFPINYWLSPASLASYILYGANPNPTVIYTVTTIEIFGSTWLLARALGMSKDVQILASWFAAILTMPFIVPPHAHFLSFYAISGLIPWLIEHVALSSLILVTVLWIFAARSNLERSAATIGFLIVTIWSVAAFTYSVILDGPLVFLFFCFFLLTNKKIFERKNIAIFLALVVGLT